MTQPDKLVSVLNEMSLRDWFAGMAITGVTHMITESMKNGADLKLEQAASFCYQTADAMLKEREKETKLKP